MRLMTNDDDGVSVCCFHVGLCVYSEDVCNITTHCMRDSQHMVNNNNGVLYK